MKKKDLMNYVGKEVTVYFKNGDIPRCGKLRYADDFSGKHEYRKPGYFYVSSSYFKVSHVKKVIYGRATGREY